MRGGWSQGPRVPGPRSPCPVSRLRVSVSRELRQLEARHQQQRRGRLEKDKRRLANIMHQLDTETCRGEEGGQGSRWCQPCTCARLHCWCVRWTLLKEAECPVCLQEMAGRIWQCQSGDQCHVSPCHVSPCHV